MHVICVVKKEMWDTTFHMLKTAHNVSENQIFMPTVCRFPLRLRLRKGQGKLL